jgi:hypothetical protein
VEVLAVTGTIADSGDAFTVILGVVMLLVFAAVVVRAFVRRGRGHGRMSTKRARGDVEAPDTGLAAAVVTEPTPVVSEQPPHQRELTRNAEPESPRLSTDTIAPLARTLERSRRLLVAEHRVRDVIRVLPEDAWLVEQHVLEDSHRIPFVVAGPTGVFVLCATDGPWTIGDLRTLTMLADRLQRRLPGWTGEIQVVMCLAFDTTEIRLWAGGSPETPYRAWLIGIDDLAQWLTAREPDRGPGLRPDDIRRLDHEALPRWDRHQTARLPKTPNFG